MIMIKLLEQLLIHKKDIKIKCKYYCKKERNLQKS